MFANLHGGRCRSQGRFGVLFVFFLGSCHVLLLLFILCTSILLGLACRVMALDTVISILHWLRRAGVLGTLIWKVARCRAMRRAGVLGCLVIRSIASLFRPFRRPCCLRIRGLAGIQRLSGGMVDRSSMLVVFDLFHGVFAEFDGSTCDAPCHTAEKPVHGSPGSRYWASCTLKIGPGIYSKQSQVVVGVSAAPNHHLRRQWT